MLPNLEYIVYVYPNGMRMAYKRVPTGRKYKVRCKSTIAFRYKLNIIYKHPASTQYA